MTIAALLATQAALHADIKSRAIELGYDPAKVEPIYDGVVDAEVYLASKPRVMWILKEPYDDFDENGNPYGGGWTMFKDFEKEGRLAEAVNRNAALRNVAYASYAMQSGFASYAELPWITDAPEKYERAIKSVAYANLGKMPGRTTTPTGRLQKICEEWKCILFRQIDLYDPEVIIVCGTDTLQALNGDFGLDLSKPRDTAKRGKAIVDVHAWRGRRLLWAPHPAAHIPPGEWVDAVIKAVFALP